VRALGQRQAPCRPEELARARYSRGCVDIHPP
jgi:hypothetical protein